MGTSAVLVWLTAAAAAASLTSLKASPTVCPPLCVCTTTPDGLHKATCSSLSDLYKFTLRQKHHNINVLDLSHNNITKLTHQLDRLTEVVTLDLSTNGFRELDRFLHNSKKLVHLNLANNRIQRISLSVLPTSISSLDLSNNLLSDVPTDLKHLKHLEHLEIEGNPLDCSCDNILARDQLLRKSVLIDHVKCASPPKYKGLSWLELKTKDACRRTTPSENNRFSDIMMGDQPVDDTAADIGKYSNMLKSMPSQALTDLDEGQTWVAHGSMKDDDDDLAFLRAKRQDVLHNNDAGDGSGEGGITDEPEYQEKKITNLSNAQLEDEQIMLNHEFTTEQSLEGSGDEGSGFTALTNLFQSETEERSFEDEQDQATTTVYKELYTNPVETFLGRGVPEDAEIPEDILPKRPNVFSGSKDWYNSTPIPTTSTTTEETVNEKIQIHKDDAGLKAETTTEENKPLVQRTGTYICIAIIVVLLIGLIGFAIVKGQIRKSRDRRLMRQQKQDVEKASKEMVDMNKSLLGKPAPTNNPADKKANGKYELVPTHETPIKKTENGTTTNNSKYNNNLNQNKSSPRDNNQNREGRPRSITQTEDILDIPKTVAPAKKDSDSLSSEDIFVPLSDETPHVNGVAESDVSQPLMNGDHNTDSDYLSPSREYVPVYSPDMGRVRIKMTETPKPKTPVLVTRSRSNAGDIIITPAVNEGISKSAT